MAETTIPRVGLAMNSVLAKLDKQFSEQKPVPPVKEGAR